MGYKTSVKNWEGLAQNDAMWSILTDKSKKGDKWNLKEFFQSGKDEVEATFKFLERNGVKLSKTKHAIDFGCGAGRLTQALSSKFEKVSGIDASETMVKLASEANTCENVDFKWNQGDDLAWMEDNSISFAMTYIVLQHIPFPQSLNFIAEFTRILEPGGILIFQVPVKDVRQLSLWQKLKTRLRIRERLALVGIGKGFQMDMHVIEETQIEQTIAQKGGLIELSAYTNQTLPDYNGKLEFYDDETAASGYMSKWYAIRKKEIS